MAGGETKLENKPKCYCTNGNALSIGWLIHISAKVFLEPFNY